MGCRNYYAFIHIGGVCLKIVYALIVILLFVVGFASLFYGLYLFAPPLAYVIGGVLILVVAYILNEAYDNTEGR